MGRGVRCRGDKFTGVFKTDLIDLSTPKAFRKCFLCFFCLDLGNHLKVRLNLSPCIAKTILQGIILSAWCSGFPYSLYRKRSFNFIMNQFRKLIPFFNSMSILVTNLWPKNIICQTHPCLTKFWNHAVAMYKTGSRVCTKEFQDSVLIKCLRGHHPICHRILY